MSLRAPPAEASTEARGRLEHVLRAGLPTQVLAEAPNENFIVIKGVRISTDPGRWTPMTTRDVGKLDLNPLMGLEAWDALASENGLDPTYSAYHRTEFRSFVNSQYNNYRFWVKYIGYVSDFENEASYYLLARPSWDRTVYPVRE